MLLWALRAHVLHRRACDCVASSLFQKKRHFKYVLTPFAQNLIEFSACNSIEMLCAMYLRNVKEHDRIFRAQIPEKCSVQLRRESDYDS